MIFCQNTSVLLALLASTLLPRVASSSAAAIVDKTYNGICDVDICTCFTYDGTACPDWMDRDKIVNNSYVYFGLYEDNLRGGSGSFSFGNATDDDSRQSLACYSYGAKFSGESTHNDAAPVSSNQTESPMHFLDGISLDYWILRPGGENSTVIVNYTASNPAPDCYTVTPPAQWSSSSEQISLLPASIIAIVAVVATLL